MKKALNLIIMYFVFLLLGLISGTLLYTLFTNLLHYVAGSELKLFASDRLLHSFFYVIFCVLLLICPAVAFYRVRHPGGFSQNITYIILCLVTWCAFLPLCMMMNTRLASRYNFAEEKIYLSKGYFRHYENDVYYFTDDFKYAPGYGMQANSIIIQTGEKSSLDYGYIKDSPGFELNAAAKPFREILVSNNFNADLNKNFLDFQSLVSSAKRALSGGILYYLFYLSFALALSSVYAITSLFDWRLLNATLLFLLSAFVLALNSGMANGLLGKIGLSLNENPVYSFLSHWCENPLLFVINILFAVILNVLWIISAAVKNHKKKADE